MFENYNINIYEKYYELEQKLAQALARIDMLEIEKQKQSDVGWYTIDEICINSGFSRKKFFDYKKLIPLPKATKLGRYKKTEANEWIEKVKKLKEKIPSLFRPNIFD
jgi:predicted DNA-binding transcriptional regulator AlpA